MCVCEGRTRGRGCCRVRIGVRIFVLARFIFFYYTNQCEMMRVCRLRPDFSTVRTLLVFREWKRLRSRIFSFSSFLFRFFFRSHSRSLFIIIIVCRRWALCREKGRREKNASARGCNEAITVRAKMRGKSETSGPLIFERRVCVCVCDVVRPTKKRRRRRKKT